jgi:hypothetical protein
MKRTETVKRDNLLVEYLLDHKGRENAVTRYDIAEYLTDNNYPTKPQTLHSIISKLIMERHLPICSINGKGYYWAKTKADILASIDELQSRITAMQEHIEQLKNFIME